MRVNFFAGSLLTALHISKRLHLDWATLDLPKSELIFLNTKIFSFSSADWQDFLTEIPFSQQNTLRGYSLEE